MSSPTCHLRPGDELTLSVDGIGALSNTGGVVEPAPPLTPVHRR